MSPLRHAPDTLTRADGDLRARYLTEVLALLYPEPCTVDGDGDEVVAEFIAVPDARRPRLLVPAGSRRVAATAVRRYARPATRGARLKRDLAAAALRTGASGALLRDRITVRGPAGAQTLGGYLAEALGTELSLSVHIGPARANRKPVLQLLTPSGDTLGFAKLGTNALTDRLVRLETAALRTVAARELSTVVTPRVLYSGRWHGHEVLVQEALPAWRPRRPVDARLPEAMREVAGCLGLTRDALGDSSYWVRLRERLTNVSIVDEGRSLRRAADVLIARASGTVLEYGAWHGDWAPWNMAIQPGAVLVWDWERFTTGVPVGFDAAHHDLQVRLERGGGAGEAVDAMLAAAPRLLAPFDVAPDAARVTAMLYLIDLATRYLADRQAQAGARLGVLGTWLLPVLIRRVEEL